MNRWRMVLGTLLMLIAHASGAGVAPELTPEQRERLFGAPGKVTLSQPSVRISMEGTDHQGFYRCPYFRVLINGRGPFTFLFDTGSGYTSVSSKVITAAGVKVEADRGGYHDVLHVDRITVGGVEIQDVTAVRDDDFGVDGVFGFRTFGERMVAFDLRHRSLYISSAPITKSKAFELSYAMSHNVPVIPVVVGDSVVATLLDTGDDAYAFELRSADMKGAKVAHSPRPASRVLNGTNEQQTSVTTLTSPVRLGPLTIEQAVAGVNDDLPVADFGVDYLKEFVFEFDPKRSVVRFQPHSSESGRQIRGNRSVGFISGFGGSGTVSAVVPHSAADDAGMAPGDTIVSIDGRPMQRYDPRRWDETLARNSRVQVTWKRGSDLRRNDFPVEELR